MFDPGGYFAHEDHVARVARQLLWGEDNFYESGFAETSQPEKRLDWVREPVKNVLAEFVR